MPSKISEINPVINKILIINLKCAGCLMLNSKIKTLNQTAVNEKGWNFDQVLAHPIFA